MQRVVQTFHTGHSGIDSDAGDGLGGGFVDPEAAAAAGEGFDRRLAAAEAQGGAAAVAGEIVTTAQRAGLVINPDWQDAAQKAANGDESAYDALVDAGTEPLVRDARCCRVRGSEGKGNSLHDADGNDHNLSSMRRDPTLRELPSPPLPPRKASPWS